MIFFQLLNISLNVIMCSLKINFEAINRLRMFLLNF